MNSPLVRRLAMTASLLTGFTLGCRTDFNAECQTGEITCKCFDDGTCKSGLDCVSDTCVDLGAETGDSGESMAESDESASQSGTTQGDGDGDDTSSGDGDDTTTGDGDGDNAGDGDGDGDGDGGDGDGDTGDGDSAGDGDGDGDGDGTTGDGDGDGTAGDGDGDGDGDTGDGDGDTGDGDGDGDGDGVPALDTDVRLSVTLPAADTARTAGQTHMARSDTSDNHLVVWRSDQVSDGELEIFGQRVGPDGQTLDNPGGFRISTQGMDGENRIDAWIGDVAWNSTANEYLVVWYALSAIGGEEEIWGQRVSASSGALVGGLIQLTDFGPAGDPDFHAYAPSVAYLESSDVYAIAFSGQNDLGKREIYSLAVAGDMSSSTTPTQLSTTGQPADTSLQANKPVVAASQTSSMFVVAWESDSTSEGTEIFRRTIGPNGAAISTALQISDMGPPGAAQYDAADPAIAWNAANNEFLVVWTGEEDDGGTFPEAEIWGQRLTGMGLPTGPDDIRISFMGPDLNGSYYGQYSDVVWGRTQWMVVWTGIDDAVGLNPSEFEIWGQALTPAGDLQGSMLRLSDLGPDGNNAYRANYPAAGYIPSASRYITTFEGADDTMLPVQKNEIWMRLWE